MGNNFKFQDPWLEICQNLLDQLFSLILLNSMYVNAFIKKPAIYSQLIHVQVLKHLELNLKRKMKHQRKKT